MTLPEEHPFIEKLKPHLTPEFLETLTMAFRSCHWTNCDLDEVYVFIKWVFEAAGKEPPDSSTFYD
jgi:hypothetical protein